jgi:translation initiation factor 5B
VVYGNRKRDNKKGPAAVASKEASPAPESPAVASKAELEPEAAAPSPVVQQATTDQDAKDDWDASSDEEEPAKAEDVKDDWDASSEEEKEQPTPAKAVVEEKKPATKGENHPFH